jgi:hypothetical protein
VQLVTTKLFSKKFTRGFSFDTRGVILYYNEKPNRPNKETHMADHIIKVNLTDKKHIEMKSYPKCENCLHWKDELCHFASPFLARRETQRKHSIKNKTKSLNCGIEGKNFIHKN